jgi:hypothetical protein
LVGDWFFNGPSLIVYAAETLVLAGSLILWVQNGRTGRWVGYVATPVLWLGSGFLEAITRAYGA